VGGRCAKEGLDGDVGRLSAWRVGVWLAILCLHIQLAATALCAAGSPFGSDQAFDNQSQASFPICHSDDDDGSAKPSGDHAPVHHHACPFCTVHCHTAMALAPVLDIFENLSHVPVHTDRSASFPVPPSVHFRTGASPRGPPSFA
jgi:hypothetical protein